MALSRTDITNGSASNVAVGTATVSGSFTPPNNSLLVLVLGISITQSSSTSRSVSGGGLTWTLQKSSSGNLLGFFGYSDIYTAPITTGASMTVSITGSGTAGQHYALVYDICAYTGHNTSTPIGATASGQDLSGGNPSAGMTLSGSPASTSEVLAVALQDCDGTGAGPYQGTGYTNLFFAGPSNGDAIPVEIEYRDSSTSTAVAFQDMLSTGASYGWVGAAVEIQASGGGGGSAYVAGQSTLSFMGMA